MKLLRSIRISQRIWLILIIALASTLIMEGISLSHLHKEIRDAEITKATHLVEVAHDLMSFYHQKELNGELTGEQARQEAHERSRRAALRRQRILLGQRHEQHHGHAPTGAADRRR